MFLNDLFLPVTRVFTKRTVGKIKSYSFLATTSLIKTHHFSLSSNNIISKICSSAQTLEQTKQAHAISILHGLLPSSLSVSGSLILKYAKFGHISTSVHLFHLSVLFSCSPFLYNTLIRAFSLGDHVPYRFELYYNAMMRNGVRPDGHTITFVFKACADCKESEKGLEVHGLAFKLGFDLDLYVGNSLMLFYGSVGDSEGLMKVFEEMNEKDVVSWNTIIGNVRGSEAVWLFREMYLRSGIFPNIVTIVSVLPVCAGLGVGWIVREIHCYVVKVGLNWNVTVCNSLIDAYGKCGCLEGMKGIFRGMNWKNEVSYNAVITCFAYSNRFRDAFDMCKQMTDVGLKPNCVTVSSMIPVLVELEWFLVGKELHGFSLRSGMVSDVYVSNSLIDMYSKFGYPKKASFIFHSMTNKNVVSWNSMIANFSQNNLELEALGVVRHMQAHGEVPNSVTLTNVLPGCARIGLLNVGKEIHAMSIRTGATFDLFVSNALIDMYAKCRCLKLAHGVFDNSLRDEISYTTLIMGYSQTSDCLKSLHLFLEMRRMGLTQDTVSFVGVLSACANQGAIKQGREIHGFMVRKLFHRHLFIANSLVDLYSKCGKIKLAKKIFDEILNKDVASWNTMVLGYGMLGETDIAINLFEDMKREGILECDSISYIAILSACSHSGLVDRGKMYFSEMVSKNIKPTCTHYACMVDLLGRAGLIQEAAELIKGLTIDPDSNVWGAMLGACRTYGDIERGCWAAEHLLELNKNHSGYYALLSNIYAQAERWEDSHKVRELMKVMEVKKTPALSWV